VRRHLFTFLQKILNQVKTASHTILFLDYDGTLVPICKEPSLAQLSLDTKKLLRDLSQNPRFSVGIISGRSLREIRKLVGIKHLFYAGNHGFEMAFQNRVWIHPALKVFNAELKKIVRGLHDHTRDINGIYIENKKITVSIHYRNVTDHSPGSILKIISQAVEPFPQHFTIARGKKVFEVRPCIDWDKGKAVEKLTHRCALKTKPMKIYIGDDQTDEDAFGVLAKDDISIRVGYKKGSAARYFCRGSGEVATFLKKLADEKHLQYAEQG
jgi:trehalose-phosphatase